VPIPFYEDVVERILTWQFLLTAFPFHGWVTEDLKSPSPTRQPLMLHRLSRVRDSRQSSPREQFAERVYVVDAYVFE